MPKTFYSRRLDKDVAQWVAAGIISGEQGDDIRADVEARSGLWAHLGFVHLLGTIGALFVGIGVILFVAANWEAIPKLARVAMALGLLWSCHGAAWWALGKKDMAWLGESALLLSALAFGAAIALIAQIFHLSSNNAGGILLWALGVFATTLVARGQFVAILGIALTCLWTTLVSSGGWNHIWNIIDLDRTHDPNLWFPLFWFAWAAITIRRQWRFATHLLVLSLTIWVWIAASPLVHWLLTVTGDAELSAISRYGTQGWSALLPLLAAVFLILIASGRTIVQYDKLEMLGQLLARYSLVWLAVMLYGLTKFVQDRSLFVVAPSALITLVVLVVAAAGIVLLNKDNRRLDVPHLLAGLAGLTLIVSSLLPGSMQVATAAILMLLNLAGWIVLLLWAYRAGHRFLVNLCFVVLTGWLLDIYFTHFWSLLDRAFFFIGGGALMVLMTFIFVRQQRRLADATGQSAEAG